ncbi:MAG: heavy-metal-associated domain-containing protein, partial [Bacteroidales bacterium]|nr:heavy-metal-associated domain-containing protein [Bacteroidales bacterium]
ERRKDKAKAINMKNDILQYRVEGMTCDHCKATVENGLKDLQGVKEVMADRANNLVSVQAESITEQQIRETIEKMGYRYSGKV